MSACHLCGTTLDDAPVVGTVARGGKESRRVCCTRCHLIQVDPMPDATALDDYYRGGYHRDHPAAPLRIVHRDGRVELHQPGTEGHEEATRVMHEERARVVIERLGFEGSEPLILEVGCADGMTLAELQKRGVDVRGIEPDETKARVAADRVGADLVYCAPLTPGLLRHVDGFDAVIAFHVLEHMPDPLASLATIRRLLRRGGRVFFEVPNAGQPSLPLVEHWQWTHLYDFTGPTLAALLHRAGFDDVHVHDAPGIVQAWAVDRGAEPRPYEHHGGVNGHDFAAALAKADHEHAAPKADEKSVAVRFLEGESVASLGDPATVEREIRREIARWRDAVNRMAKAYRDATDMVGTLGDQLDAGGVERLESWHPDPYVHGFAMGEGNAMLRARSLLAYLGNAMRMREIGDAAWEENA